MIRLIGFISTIMVSSSTDVASVEAASSGEERELAALDWTEELGGDGLSLTSTLKPTDSSIFISSSFTVIDNSSIFTGTSAFAFFNGCESEGDNGSKSLFRLTGV
jgi:hypothetical protein